MIFPANDYDAQSASWWRRRSLSSLLNCALPSAVELIEMAKGGGFRKRSHSKYYVDAFEECAMGSGVQLVYVERECFLLRLTEQHSRFNDSL